MNNLVRNSSSSRSRLNSDNRNAAVLNHFQYQHIHLKTKGHNKENDIEDQVIETDESVDNADDDMQKDDDFELVTMNEVDVTQEVNHENVAVHKSVDYAADEKLWSD